MRKEEVYSEVKEMLLEAVNKQKHRPTLVDTSLNILGLDSIAIIYFVISVEERYGIELEDEDLLFENYESIEQIVQMLDKYI